MDTLDRRTLMKATLGAGFCAAISPVWAQTITTPATGLVAGEVKVPSGGVELPAYRAAPEGKGPFPVVLVVHEIFGVHEHIKDVCRRFAAAGYYAIAPDLFAREGDASAEKDMQKLMSGIVAKTPDADVAADLDATLAFAANAGVADVSRAAVAGFCWGGREAWLYAAHNPKLKAGLAWYGPLGRPTSDLQPRNPPDIAAQLKVPVLGQYGKLHTFNPAAVVKDGKVCVLYRAEDQSGAMKIGGHTSRCGQAISDDGLHFARQPKPVLFPAADDQQKFEGSGGCEDPRLAERNDGTFVVTFTQYNGHDWRLGLASSKDLVHWTKHGSPFAGTRHENWHIKSAAIVHEVRDGRLVAARIKGKYWMYFGEASVHTATSDDLIVWKPNEDSSGKPREVMLPRRGRFDSSLTEIGPQAVRTAKGIVVFYNGKNADPAKGGDRELSGGVYACGQALFSSDDPTRLVARLDRPFFKPELPWEKTGQYAAGTTFSEGLVLFKGQWFLYYGCADTFVGVATAPAK